MLLLFAACFLAQAAHADTFSYTGTLGNGQAGNTCTDAYGASCYYALTFSLAEQSNITIQSWGFGGTNGGTNGAGNTINAGGFDELIALWSGTGAVASLVDGSADVLANFGSYAGCPPAGTVSFANGDNVCGDLTMQFSLAAGTYTITLSDANYQPNALTCCGTTIGDGFADLTAGEFQTCDYNVTSGQTACINPSADWAFDLTVPGGPQPTTTPEPATLTLLASGVLIAWRLKRQR